jgi:hypothetical protein
MEALWRREDITRQVTIFRNFVFHVTRSLNG